MTTGDQALCMLFNLDYIPENVEICNVKIKDVNDVDVCYLSSEDEPVLAPLRRIRSHPLKYKLYLDERPERRRPELTTKVQVKQFIDEVFCSFELVNKGIYSKKNISTKDIHETVKTYTTVFRDKSDQSFAAWCRSNKLNFLSAKVKSSKVTRFVCSRERLLG